MSTIKRLGPLAMALSLLGNFTQAGTPSTAFTYQGRLLDNGNPANEDYDLRIIKLASESCQTSQ